VPGRAFSDMNYDHSTSPMGSDVSAQLPQFEAADSPVPPPPPPRLPADFATSAAMAKDILALGTDVEEALTPPPPPTELQSVGPRPVPDLDVEQMPVTPESPTSSPMAPDFFLTSSRPSRSKVKKKLRRISR